MAKLTAQQRKAASIDLTLTYLTNYYADWRYAKVLTLEKLIKTPYEFYDELKDKIRNENDEEWRCHNCARNTSWAITLMLFPNASNI